VIEAFVPFLGGYRMNNVKSIAEALPSAKTSGLAIASLVLGICGIFTCGLSAIAGLVLGIVGLYAIEKRAEQLKGQALAIAGIIVSAISIVLIFFTAIMMALLMPAFAGARTQAKTALSMNNAKQLCLAINLYCEENDGRFPPADIWPAALAPYLGDEKILESPFAPHTGLAWAMNRHLNGRNIRDIKQPHRTVLIFEATIGGPPAGGRELMIHRPRGRRGHIIGFVDGHVECVRAGMLDRLIWIPGAQKQPYDIIR
jgi:prepilin-type processing-associated H-X9-DG protein